MGAGYQEDKKEQYEKMMKEIAGHPDFGKRNPVDIGIECGYLEEDAMEMIQFIYDFKDKRRISGNGSEGEKYYFLLKKDGKPHIVSVNINTWKVKIVKEVTGRFFYFQIKGSIFAWTDGERRLFWEDLENGDKGEFLADTYIKSILILEKEIIAASRDEIIRFNYDGRKEVLNWRHTGDCSIMLQGKEKIYIVTRGYGTSYIWSVGKEKFESLKEVFYAGSKFLSAVEYTERGLCWYVENDDRIGINGIQHYRRYYSEQNPKLYSICSGEDIGLRGNFRIGIRTKNYKLLDKKICKIEGGQCVFDFNRAITIEDGDAEYFNWRNEEANDGQVIGIYDKDIFIGVRKKDIDNEAIIKIDLKNEENASCLQV